MRILAFEGGYVNAEWIDSYEIREDNEGWAIRAYEPKCASSYVLGRFTSEETAREHLDNLVKWLVHNESGIFDMK